MNLITIKMPYGDYCTFDEDYCECCDSVVGQGMTAEESVKDYHESVKEQEQAA